MTALRGRLTAGFGGCLAAIAAGGLALRVGWILIGDWTPERQIGDAGFFHAVANLVAAGHGFSLPGDPAHAPTAGHPPLHPLLLALPSALGLTEWTAHRLVGGLEGAATVVLIGLVGRRVGGTPAGLMAAALAALYPNFVRIDGSVMSEPLAGLLVSGSLLAALTLLDRPRPATALALGALVGLAAETRSEAVLLLALLALPAAWLASRRRLASSGLALAACAVVMAPWTIRNAAEFHRFAPLASNSGTALAGANCAATYGGPDLGFWRYDCARARTHGNELDRAGQLRAKALRYARDHAGRLPVVAAARALRTWDLFQPWRQAALSEGGHVTLARIGVVAYYLVALLALAGAAMIGWRRELLVLGAPVILVTVTAVATLGAPRLRFSAEPSLLVLAAVALVHLRRRVVREGMNSQLSFHVRRKQRR